MSQTVATAPLERRREIAQAWAYEEDLAPILYLPCAERLVDLIQLRPGESVLDVACGTGAVARVAAERVGPHGSVVGLDANAGMLQVAAETASDAGAAVTWHQADAVRLPFEDDRFDVVFCQQGLQHMPEPHLVLAEMYRVLRPGGRLALSVWRRLHHNPAWALVADVVARHVGATAGDQMRSPFGGGNVEVLRRLLKTVGFETVVARIETRDMRLPCAAELFRQKGDAAPFADSLATMDDASWRRFVTGLTLALEEYTDDDGLVLPLQDHILLAGK